MSIKDRGALTEPMFYVLMAFNQGEMCGTEITHMVQFRTNGRVILGPGTLYTLLGKFMEEKLIEETQVQGRKRTYRITDKGREVYREEVARLRTCLSDAMDAERGIMPSGACCGIPAPAIP